METTVNTLMFKDEPVIVTENAEGEMYLIHSKYIQDILDDWTGDCNFVPANDARVFFASWNGKPISPYEYTDFESLAWYLKVKILKDTDHKGYFYKGEKS